MHLVGNSLGGLVSVLVAARRPDLVATLTLISPAMPVYRVPPAFSRALLLLLLPGVPALAERRMAGITPEQQRAGHDPDVLRRPVAGAAGAARAGGRRRCASAPSSRGPTRRSPAACAG